jgi:hypothetical protein
MVCIDEDSGAYVAPAAQGIQLGILYFARRTLKDLADFLVSRLWPRLSCE